MLIISLIPFSDGNFPNLDKHALSYFFVHCSFTDGELMGIDRDARQGPYSSFKVQPNLHLNRN